MGIFEKLKDVFEKKEEAEIARSMGLDELESWVENEIQREEEGGVEECNPITKEIEEVRDDAVKILKKIDEKKFSEEIEKRMYKPVKTAKPIFVKGMREALRHIKPKEFQDYENLLSFQRSFVNSLKSIGSFQRGPGRHVAFGYREEMLMLGTELNSLIDLSNKLKEIIEEKEENLATLEDISSNIREIKTNKEKKLETTTTKKELKDKRKKLKRQKTSLEKKLKTLEKSDAFQQFLSKQKEVEALKEERARLKGQIYNQLHPLKRVFKKFRRLAEKGTYQLKKEDLGRCGDYIDHPYQTFLLEDIRNPALLNILKGAKESIQSGELHLKAKEKSKMANRIQFLEKNCKEMWGKDGEINRKEKSLIDKLSDLKISTEIEGFQKKMRGIEESLEDLEKEEVDIDKERSEREKRIETLLKDIETLASDLMGQGIKIHEGALSSQE
ncbi:MAG: hypothetical protein V3R82_01475 [Candidatus Hydrothermarchaeales archaeon]